MSASPPLTVFFFPSLFPPLFLSRDKGFSVRGDAKLFPAMIESWKVHFAGRLPRILSYHRAAASSLLNVSLFSWQRRNGRLCLALFSPLILRSYPSTSLSLSLSRQLFPVIPLENWSTSSYSFGTTTVVIVGTPT